MSMMRNACLSTFTAFNSCFAYDTAISFGMESIKQRTHNILGGEEFVKSIGTDNDFLKGIRLDRQTEQAEELVRKDFKKFPTLDNFLNMHPEEYEEFALVTRNMWDRLWKKAEQADKEEQIWELEHKCKELFEKKKDFKPLLNLLKDVLETVSTFSVDDKLKFLNVFYPFVQNWKSETFEIFCFFRPKGNVNVEQWLEAVTDADNKQESSPEQEQESSEDELPKDKRWNMMKCAKKNKLSKYSPMIANDRKNKKFIKQNGLMSFD